MAIVGFFIGVLVARSQSMTGNDFIEIAGLISLVFGIGFMLGGKGATGVGGGLLTGFGLGASLGSFLWPPSLPVFSS
jgi:hypothetical protein